MKGKLTKVMAGMVAGLIFLYFWGKKLQKKTDDLFQRGIHHQHDELYLGLVRRCLHG